MTSTLGTGVHIVLLMKKLCRKLGSPKYYDRPQPRVLSVLSLRAYPLPILSSVKTVLGELTFATDETRFLYYSLLQMISFWSQQSPPVIINWANPAAFAAAIALIPLHSSHGLLWPQLLSLANRRIVRSQTLPQFVRKRDHVILRLYDC